MLSNLQTDNAQSRQEELEREMYTNGGKKFRDEIETARKRGRESETSHGHGRVARHIIGVSDAITAVVAAGQEGPNSNLTPIFLTAVAPDVAAFIALKVVIDAIMHRVPVATVANRIASMIEDEVRFTFFKNGGREDAEEGTRKGLKALFRTLKKNLDSQTSNYDHKRTVMIHSMSKAGTLWLAWPRDQKLQLGVKLIDIVIEKTQLAQLSMDKHKKRTVRFLGATDETLKLITEEVGAQELTSALWQPMVIPPVDWKGSVGGGYLCTNKRKTNLVKAWSRQYQEELAATDLDLVNRAVNGMQRTAWKVNTDVLGVMAEVWKTNSRIGKLPDQEREMRPTKPLDIETNDDARKQWKRTVSNSIKNELKLASRRLQVSSIIVTAKKFANEPAIYFPYQLDFRGRAYSIPSGLQPQGHDLAKSLLTFSHGKPLGNQEAADWLAVHGANLYGNDKVSLKERVQWVKTNEKHIVESARAPLDYLWWAQEGVVDKPWQFLAFCFEWLGFLKQGLEFVSCLPIALDGSCNGLQHFSAMLRDPIGGAAVNLIPSEQPQDIYQAVADLTIKKLKKDTNPLATTWLAFGINRKTVKRCVMVVPYGGTKHSSREYIMEYTKKRIEEDGEKNLFGDKKQLFLACLYLSGLVWEAISEVVVAARDAMGWLQEVSKVVSKENKPINWKSPSGFPVIQSYWNSGSERVKTKMAGEVVKLSLAREPGPDSPLDRRRQAQSISPNFVHSLDSAALVYTVDAALDLDLDSFGMVHDSYATTAADTESLRACCRNAFCSMYQTDVLDEFRREVQAGLKAGVELPPLPPKGTLDINLVLQSDFFFA